MTTTGAIDGTFITGTGANNSVKNIALHSANRVIIVGDFTSYNGASLNRIARLNSNGSIDATFITGLGANGTINAIAIQSDGKIIIGGNFTSYNGTSVGRIARLNFNGSLDATFNTGTGLNDIVKTIAIQSDGKVLIGGNFTSVNSAARSRIARLNSNGSIDTSFDPATGANNSISVITLQNDGKIIVGGNFTSYTSYNGPGFTRITRLLSNGYVDYSFNSGTGVNNEILTASLQSDTKLVIAGSFTGYNEIGRNHVARVITCTTNATVAPLFNFEFACPYYPFFLTHTTTGTTGIGPATGLPPGVTASWSSNAIIISGNPAAIGVFDYSIPLLGGCGIVNATGTIIIQDQAYASSASSIPTVCRNSSIIPITHTTFNTFGIGAPTGLPSGVTASWASNTITISGTPSVSGVFNYFIPLISSGCGSSAAIGTITVTNSVSAGAASSSPSVCLGSAIPTITHSTIGATGIGTAMGLPAGVTASWSSNSITISGTPTASGIFNYSIPLTSSGCGASNATGTITVTNSISAGAASSSPTVCINSIIPNITHTTSGATGIGTPTGLPSGVTASWSSNTITISGTPLSGGVFSYSIPLTGGCGAIQATGTISVTNSNTAGAASSSPTVCLGSAIPSITHTTTGATGIGASTGLPAGLAVSWASNTIAISGTPTTSGVFNYSIPLTGGCGASVSATGTIRATNSNTAGSASSSPTVCINAAIPTITHTTSGATGIGTATGLPTGVTASWSSNTISISGTPTTSGVFSYSIPLTGGCGTSVNATGTIRVTNSNTTGAASSSPTVCINSPITTITHTTTGATGIGTATGLPSGVTASWSANTITISGTPNSSGVFSYIIPLTGGCGTSVSATGTIRATNSNTAGSASSSPTVCINSPITNITHTTTGATGIGTATGLPSGVTASWSANTITISGTPNSSGVFSYNIPLTGGCGTSVSATGTIRVTNSNTAGSASSSPTVCLNSPITTITHATTGATGIGTATGLPSGVTASWSANTITISGTPTTSGVFSYIIPLTGGCGTSVTATGTIRVTNNNTTGAASSSPTVCINSPITTITHTTTGATGIGASTGLPAGVTVSWASNTITISGTPTASGVFNYSIPLTGGCGSSVSATGSIVAAPNLNEVDIQVACNSLTWIDGNTYTTSNNTATFNLIGAGTNGCDKLITLNLTIQSISDISTTLNGTTLIANNPNASYRWLDCSNGLSVVPGATSQTFTPTVTGSYAVELTESECVAISTCTNIATTNVTAYSKPFEIKVFPNPIKDNFNIDFGKQIENGQVSISDIAGKKISSFSISNAQEMNISIDKPAGIYFINVQSESEYTVLKVLKE